MNEKSSADTQLALPAVDFEESPRPSPMPQSLTALLALIGMVTSADTAALIHENEMRESPDALTFA